jgi:hypothetical protein
MVGPRCKNPLLQLHNLKILYSCFRAQDPRDDMDSPNPRTTRRYRPFHDGIFQLGFPLPCLLTSELIDAESNGEHGSNQASGRRPSLACLFSGGEPGLPKGITMASIPAIAPRSYSGPCLWVGQGSIKAESHAYCCPRRLPCAVGYCCCYAVVVT